MNLSSLVVIIFRSLCDLCVSVVNFFKRFPFGPTAFEMTERSTDSVRLPKPLSLSGSKLHFKMRNGFNVRQPFFQFFYAILQLLLLFTTPCPNSESSGRARQAGNAGNV